MNLYETIKTQLEEENRHNITVFNKLVKVRDEVDSLSKHVGIVEIYFDGFSYYTPDKRTNRNKRVFRVYVETRSLYIHVDQTPEREDITYTPLDVILTRISRAITKSLAASGKYSI